MSDTGIPDVDDTDLTREEMEEVAAEYDIDTDDLDDQELLEELGVALGELDPDDVDGGAGDSGGSGGGVRGRVASGLGSAAEKVRPSSSDDRSDDTDDDDEGGDADEADDAAAADADDGGDEGDAEDGADEQTLPGEPIKGPTRNELRDRLRELGLPLSGTKDELQQRLDEAEQGGEEDSGEDGDEDDPAEQSLPGEPIEGPTRNELRDRLRELGLPLSGTKDELQQRLDEAEQADDGEDDASDDGQDSEDAEASASSDDSEDGEDGEDGEDADDGDDSSRIDELREKVAHALRRASEKVADEDDEDEDDEDDEGEDDEGEDDEDAEEDDEGEDEGIRAKLGHGIVHVGEKIAGDDQEDDDEDDEDDQEDDDEDDEDEDDDEGGGGRLRDRVASGLESTAGRLRGSGEPGRGVVRGTASKLVSAGSSVIRKVTPF
ncbi:MAG: SAP domain-containing protein [Nitriliruptor sp.]